METNHDDERRKYNRVDFKTRLLLTVADARIEAEGSSRDLSQKGVFIYTLEKFSPGTLCSVRIFLSGGGNTVELSMDGKVARVEENGLGISFVTMDLDSYTHLRNIVRYNKELD